MTLPGQVMDGNSVSSTSMMKEQVLVLPLTSVAWRMMELPPTGAVEPFAGPKVCVTVAPPQLSLAMGSVKLIGPTQVPWFWDTVELDGQVRLGAWPSVTVTVKEQVALLAEASVTRKVLVVTPTG